MSIEGIFATDAAFSTHVIHHAALPMQTSATSFLYRDGATVAFNYFYSSSLLFCLTTV